MHIEQLLKSLFLPKRYYGETFSIAEKINEEKASFHKGLMACLSEDKKVNKAIGYADRKSQIIFDLLTKTLNYYEKSDLRRAQETFERLMNAIKSDLFYTTLFDEITISTKEGTFRTRIRATKPSSFFRIRAVKSKNSSIEDNANELFHVPVIKRQLISNERFSLCGFPTLYLATMLPLAWQECGYPDKYYWSEYQYLDLEGFGEECDMATDGKIRLLALYSPHEIAIWGMSLKYNKPELWVTVVRRYLAIYPLVLACSFINANGGTPFKQEYIIPQMLMQWVYRHKRKCNGISYFSCMDDSVLPDKWNAYNIALPAMKPYDNDGYSLELQRWFNWSMPRYHAAPTSEISASAEDRKILNTFADQELSALNKSFVPQTWNDLYWKMVKVAMQMRAVLEFSSGANLKMVLAALDAIGEGYNAICCRRSELNKKPDLPKCKDEKTRLQVERGILIAQEELNRAADWFMDNTTGSNGIGWIIEKYTYLIWNYLHEDSIVCVASLDKDRAVQILMWLKEHHVLCCYRQLEEDDSTAQWLQEIARSENSDIAIFWGKEILEGQGGPEWIKMNIKSIKNPILVRRNYTTIFTPNERRRNELLGIGDDMEKLQLRNNEEKM